MKFEKWLKQNTSSLQGKTIAISGSTGGLGEQVCNFVAKLGGDLILLNRNKEKTEAQMSILIDKYGIKVKMIKVDMVDICSVKEMCEELKKEKVDFLILNAGAYSLPRKKASTGYDQVFQINFISPYFIVKQMLPSLKESKAKLVVVGSIAHKYSKINEKDIDFSNVKAPRKVYGNAKRFLMFSLFELFKNQKDATLSICHPGITPTNITSHYSKFIQAIVKYPMKMVFSSPKKASLNVVKGIFENCPGYSWIGPRVCDIWGRPKLKPLKTCKEVESKKIFEMSEKIYRNL